jgi:hypothetical protein
MPVLLAGEKNYIGSIKSESDQCTHLIQPMWLIQNFCILIIIPPAEENHPGGLYAVRRPGFCLTIIIRIGWCVLLFARPKAFKST